jgi:hypothetical protein
LPWRWSVSFPSRRFQVKKMIIFSAVWMVQKTALPELCLCLSWRWSVFILPGDPGKKVIIFSAAWMVQETALPERCLFLP